MIRRRTPALAAALAALGGVAAGCGGDDEDTATATPSSSATPGPMGEAEAAGDAAVTIRTFMYEPDPIEVEAGTTVMFTNEDDILHTVTEGTKEDLARGGFDAQLDGAGSTAEVTFEEPGTIKYTCTIHQGMDGEAIVN